MKKFLLPILLLHLAMAVNAATYYFSNSSGDDSRTATQAQSSSTPWKTISKLNSIMSTLKAGDQVLFKRGDTFSGAITVTVSGTSSQPITFSAYSSGNNPVITGFATLSGWSQARTNVWEAALTTTTGIENMVMLNSQQQAVGRYPNRNAANGGYLTINSHNGANELTSSQLPSSPNWTGAEIAIRKNRWQIDRSKVSYHVGNTVGFDAGSSASISDKYGFFIQNSTNTLDQNGEWFYDKSRNKLQMYFSSNNPNSYTVKASNVETLVTISAHNYIKFSNLSFTGANSYTFNLSNCNNITVDACTISFSGIDVVQGLSTTYFVLSNSTISNTNNNDLYLYWNCNNTTITNNVFKNTGTIPGMGLTGNGTYEGIIITGNNNLIQYNELDSTGYNGIHFEGDYSTVSNNFINTFGFVLDDCGGIYTGQGLGDNTQYHNKSISNNIVINGIGATAGTDDTTYIATQGIYLDDNTNNVTVDGNTTANCGQTGIFNHNATYTSIHDNTMYNNGKEQFLVVRSGNPVSNVNIYNNIMFAKTATQLASRMESYSGTNDLSQIGYVDHNYYCRPIDNNYIFYDMYYANGQYYTSYDNFQDWQSKFSLDGNSQGAPATFPSFNYSNPSGINLFPNGGFVQNDWNVATYSSTGDIAIAWNSNKLDAGTLQVSAKSYSSSNNFNLTMPTDNSVTGGQGYLLSFSLLGSSSTARPMDVYLRQEDAPNQDLSQRSKIQIKNSRQEMQFGLTALQSSRVSIEMNVTQPNGPFYVDNVMLQKATITQTNPDDYIVFQYNGTNQTKSFTLSGTYYDAKGQTYSGNVTLQPYKSLVLFKSGTSQFTSTATASQAIAVKGSLNTSAAAISTSSAATDITWQVDNQDSTAISYDVQRSSDAVHFTSIGTASVKNAIDASTHTASATTYQFKDASPLGGKNYYRIQQNNAKIAGTISSIVVVNNISFKINPNPAKDVIHLMFDQPVIAAEHLGKEVVIRNAAGTFTQTLPITVTENMNRADINVFSLMPGMYILSVTSDGQSFSQKFMKL